MAVDGSVCMISLPGGGGDGFGAFSFLGITSEV